MSIIGWLETMDAKRLINHLRTKKHLRCKNWRCWSEKVYATSVGSRRIDWRCSHCSHEFTTCREGIER